MLNKSLQGYHCRHEVISVMLLNVNLEGVCRIFSKHVLQWMLIKSLIDGMMNTFYFLFFESTGACIHTAKHYMAGLHLQIGIFAI